MGAVFKLVPEWFPDRVGAVTGVVGAAGGLGGFFPPLVMGVVKSATGGYALGFLLMALVAVAAWPCCGRDPPATGRRARRLSEDSGSPSGLHVLAMALFVGGQIFLVAAVIPAMLSATGARRCA